MLHWPQAGSAGKMAKYSMWHSVKKNAPFWGAAIPYDIQPYLAFLFKRKEKLCIKIACVGLF